MRQIEELDATYTDAAFRSNLVEAFSLSQIAGQSYSTDVFDRLAGIAEAVHLTSAGEEACARVEAEGTELNADELKVAAFLAFYWDELYVDVDATDREAIAATLDAAVRDRALRLPWLYGRLVDEVYLARFREYEYELDEDATATLVGELPQGVWQVGPFVTGPYGLLRSTDTRWLLPGTAGPAVGCTDPGCDALHRIRLTLPTSPIRDAQALIDGAASDASGGAEPAQWPLFARTLTLDKGGDYYHDDLNPSVLAPCLPNAFSETELRAITSVLLRRDAATIHAALRDGEGVKLDNGSPEEVTSGLSASEALQVLWLADDATLVESIEQAIDDGRVEIPATETRGPVVVRAIVHNGMYDVACEIGPAGVRFVPMALRPSVAMRLRKLIGEIYSEEEDQEHLAWKLRDLPGAEPDEQVDRYLATTAPSEVVEELLFESRSRLERAFASLRWGLFAVPLGEDEERRLVNRLLWKLGVDLFDFPQVLPLFWERLDGLRKVARELGHPYGEAEREALRGPGTNLVVSIEDVLERAVSFAAWALLHDHWLAGRRNRFVYTPQRARTFAASVFDGQELGDGNTLEFSASSKNTLLPLIAAFGILARRCEELLEDDPRQLERPTSELPHFLREGGVERFPFRHVHPFLDLRRESAETIISALRQVQANLDRGSVLDVRNRIPHNREPFPSQEEIERASLALDDVVGALEELGVSAAPFLLESASSDRHGQSIIRLVDYAGREFEVYEPTALRMTEMPPTQVPQLIFQAARIAGTSEVLRFSYREDSQFLERWAGFPSRTPLPALVEP